MATAKKNQPKQIQVKVGAFPGGKIASYTLPAGSTVRDALKAAELNSTGNSPDVRVNGQRASSLDQTVEDGSQVLLFSQVRGN